MAEPIFINDLIQKVIAGQIKIPSFQRGFVWDADRGRVRHGILAFATARVWGERYYKIRKSILINSMLKQRGKFHAIFNQANIK